VNKARLSAFVLLGAATAGTLGAPAAPRRFGRPGRLAVIAGVMLLAVRDAAMVLGGAPGRLKPVPRGLLYLELACAVSAALLGAAAGLRASEPAAQSANRPRRSCAVSLDSAASTASALTFGVHAVRQAIYVMPGQGRIAQEPRTDGAALGGRETR
jgi:hypothetical protein